MNWGAFLVAAIFFLGSLCIVAGVVFLLTANDHYRGTTHPSWSFIGGGLVVFGCLLFSLAVGLSAHP